MKLLRLLLLPALLLGLTACSPRTYVRVNDLTSYLRYEPGKKPQISAHRGGGDYTGYPENCLESFAFLARRMPVVIETDIAMTRDSVLLMMHDDTYERTTTGSGRVADQSWEYARSLYLEDNKGNRTRYHIPTLDEVLKWGENKVIYTLDVKRSVPLHRVVEAVQEAGAANYAAIITYTVQQAELVHRLDPGLTISVTIRNREEYQRLREAGVPDNRMVAFVGTREAPAELYEFLHQKGILCILGTLGNLDNMALARGDEVYRKFVENGADILSTDRPIEAGKVLGLVK
ncbi:glycerophosphodiester phosphodiesterase family protein [Telluribacter sp.]|jgi:glycerophosphoryl diester phosphodiesterase|uniref:glycerophosphodiester phosphodiesterase family protein n=1 Tax=Telluribacter sp. TaxID=1978767 RepID=UPI002E12C84D|nr:glycerophosphodiester phosphodiesterase family protein [Telluribacter sp.]